jgi:hypothetical protein
MVGVSKGRFLDVANKVLIEFGILPRSDLEALDAAWSVVEASVRVDEQMIEIDAIVFEGLDGLLPTKV